MTTTVTCAEAQTLSPSITFELIPECPAAIAAGYTEETRARAQISSSPVISGQHFYYTAWYKSPLSSDHLSSILVCRHVNTGELVYARNCAEYSLDSAANYMGNKTVICKTQLFILGTTLYLCNSAVSNLGPMLFAVELSTGKLLWAAAYYPPEGAPSNYITEKGDYSQFVGSNNRTGDLSPTGGIFTDKDGKSRKLIFVGSSSCQNVVDTMNGGFPIYTDQGMCACIEDLGDSSSLYWITNTCAPSPKIGDVLKKGGPAHLDPFRPTEDKVVLFSVTSAENNFLQPHYLTNQGVIPDPVTPIVANVIFNKHTVIDEGLIQQIWSSVPNIYLDGDRATSYKIAQLITLWNQEQEEMEDDATKKHIIWSYVTPDIIQLATIQGNNSGIGYFKFLSDGQTVEHPADVSGLGYWGNSVRGAAPTILEDKNLVLFGTGQGHDIIEDESLYYSQPNISFAQQKKAMLDVVDRFVSGQGNLANVNASKKYFIESNSLEALNTAPKAPRGRMSYSDAIVACYIVSKKMGNREVIGGDISFAVRSVPWDSYSFLTDQSKAGVYPVSGLNADVSSGIHYYTKSGQSLLSTAIKGGLGLTIDITKLNENVVFDHNNLAQKGVVVSALTYNGPNSVYGGANSVSDKQGNIVVTCQTNTPNLGGSISSAGILEKQVSVKGEIITAGDSYIQAYNMITGEVLWEQALGNKAMSDVRISNGVVYASDLESNLYCIDLISGNMLWKHNNKSGGITCPALSKKSVIWLSSHNGTIFKPDSKIAVLPRDNPFVFMNGKSFTSWDSAPKAVLTPGGKPSIYISVSQQWSMEKAKSECSSCKCQVLVSSTTVTTNGVSATFRMVMDKYDLRTLTMTFKDEVCQGLTLANAKLVFFNKNSYSFEYTDPVSGEKVRAWLEQA